MKLALRWIPTEVWVDIFVFPWITRKTLGRIVDRFRNRYFVEILQYCLHDRGKRTLAEVYLNYYEETPGIPRTPMPENIKFFEQIGIRHFDWRILDFLRRVSTLFIDNDVNLIFDYLESKLANLRPIFDQLTPLLHRIHSLAFDQSAIPLVEQYFGPKLAQVKLLSIDRIDFQSGINFCLNWLTSEGRDPAEPKFLAVDIYNYDIFQQFSLAVQQQFQSAKRPYTFVIKLRCYGGFDFQLDVKNNIGEQFWGQFIESTGHFGHFQIFRQQTSFPRTQLEEWAKEMVEKHATSRIQISPRLTIGQIDASAGDNAANDSGGDEADDAQQPSTSKKQ